MRFKEDRLLSLNNDVANATDTGSIVTSDSPDTTSEALLARILTSLDEDKAEDVVQIDLRGKTSIGDYMVICTGRSSRQVTAIAEKLIERLKAEFGRGAKVEGKETGDWVLVDTGDVILHIFRPEVREFYQLEKMWVPGGAA
ncbi:ribosome-associated protein [Shimia sagamensis]|uniref:Ribosomal silencing factor RsfS n=1 Tax=Shimia sagamensis TaxID=1566352 RepID=A0ABY1N8F7_9RHOB|nr:ribosome-associated protein [Shimia sagamensis]